MEIEKEKKLYWENMESLFLKLGSSGRVKYSCLDISKNYILLGANTGSFYFYERETLRFITLLSLKEIREPISLVKFNYQGNLIAISTIKATLCILEINLNQRKDKEKIIYKNFHKEEITCLQWDYEGNNLFFGDQIGNITMISFNKNRFRNLEIIFKCDSSIVQLSFQDDILLASSLSRCTVIYPLQKQNSIQIGSQLRDGKFGACFHPDRSTYKGFILAARPGIII